MGVLHRVDHDRDVIWKIFLYAYWQHIGETRLTSLS